MRQAAHTKMGFYPIPLPVLREQVLPNITIEDETAFVNILDPCAGEGEALKCIADYLMVPYDECWAIELDQGRSLAIDRLMPEVNMVREPDEGGVPMPTAASLFGMDITGHSFSLAYVNPPFSYDLGGERSEVSFLGEVSRKIVAGGLLIFICPERSIQGEKGNGRALREHLDTYYEDMDLFRFTPKYRQYGEIVITGVRRRTWSQLTPDLFMYKWYSSTWGEQDRRTAMTEKYVLKGGKKPKRFHKVDYANMELIDDLNKSPLRTLLEVTEDVPLERPPLPLYEGHTSLLLCAGILDGVVAPAGEEPHVLRGSAYKEVVVTEETETETQERTVSVDVPKLLIRTVDRTGVILDYTN